MIIAWIIGSLILAYLIYGVFDIRKNIFVNSISSTDQGNICLTFDDGPETEMTTKILDVLKMHNIKATFFLIGDYVRRNRDIVTRMHNEGHCIGNHTYFHKRSFPVSSLSSMEEEISRTNNEIYDIIKEKIDIFRPPFGITNPNINKAIKQSNMISIGWDIRSLDTITKDANRLYNRVIGKIDKGGSIILFHDRCESTSDILEKVIVYCKQKGLKFKTIREIIHEN